MLLQDLQSSANYLDDETSVRRCVGGVGWFRFDDFFCTMQSFNSKCFQNVMIDALVVPSTLSNQLLVWCCHKSWKWTMNGSTRSPRFESFTFSSSPEKFQVKIKTSIAFVQIPAWV